MSKLRTLLPILAALLFFGPAACSDDDDNNTVPSNDATDGIDSDSTETLTGEVRVVHASWDAPAVDIYVDGAEPAAGSALDALSFTDATAYIALPIGDYDIAVVPDGQTLADAVFSADDVTLPAGASVTFWAYGSLTAENFGVGIIVDDRDSGSDANITIAHAASGVGPVDIYLDGTLSAVTNVNLGVATTSPVTVPPATYEVGIAATGASDTLVDFDATIPAPGYYGVFAIGDPESDAGVQLLAVLESGVSLVLDPKVANAYIRVFHGADAPTVDVWINDAAPAAGSSLDDLAQYEVAGGDSDGYIAVPAGSYDVAVTTADETDVSNAVIDVNGVSLEADTYYTAFAYGSAAAASGSDDALGLGLIVDDLSEIAAEEGRLSVAHSATGVGPVDIFANGNKVAAFSDLDLGEATGTLDLATATYTFGIGVAGAADPLLEYTTALPAARVTGFAIGDLDDGVDLAIVTPTNAVIILAPDVAAD